MILGLLSSLKIFIMKNYPSLNFNRYKHFDILVSSILQLFLLKYFKANLRIMSFQSLWNDICISECISEKGEIFSSLPQQHDHILCYFKCFLFSCCSVTHHVQLSVTPWTAACQASLSFTISWSLHKLMSIESMMPSNHLILCHPLLLPEIFPSIRVFSSESALHIRWPKYWSFNVSISPPMNIQGWFPLGLTSLITLLSSGLSRVFTSMTVRKHQFLGAQSSLWSNTHIRRWLL